ncbi:MAG: flavin reductase [Candidatus Avoscillospira sp.]
MNPSALYSLSYGLFVLTARQGDKDNGCIVNTVQQVTSSPMRVSVAVNKANYTHDMILATGLFNVSILNQDAPFAVFQHYGFQSGRDTDKIVGEPARSANGLVYVPAVANAYLSCKVVQTIDLGTHTMFLADVTDADVLNKVPSMTYAYYHANVKPKPQPKAEKKTGWQCKVCGYVYEGETLPPDFVCPLCKHGAEDFEKIG